MANITRDLIMSAGYMPIFINAPVKPPVAMSAVTVDKPKFPCLAKEARKASFEPKRIPKPSMLHVAVMEIPRSNTDGLLMTVENVIL